jgi:hypothetical protein
MHEMTYENGLDTSGTNRGDINFSTAKKRKTLKKLENRPLRLAFIGSPRLILGKRDICILVGHPKRDNV